MALRIPFSDRSAWVVVLAAALWPGCALNPATGERQLSLVSERDEIALGRDGAQQVERTLGFVYFLNKYGPALVDRLGDELPLEMGNHWIVTI